MSMDNTPYKKAYAASLSNKEFQRLSEFVYERCGIRMPPTKKTLLEGRLRKRLNALGMESFEEYCGYLFSPGRMETECIHMIDVVTTNKTDFFREPAHFDYLMQKVLPELVNTHGMGIKTRLNVWSTACSTGEEPYTLAMVLSEYAQAIPDLRFHIIASDISTRVLEKAKCGIYEHDSIDPVPMALRKKYLLRGKDNKKGMVRITPELRSLINFRRINLMDQDYGIGDWVSVIFCRNVLIYFDKPTQEKVLGNLCETLIQGGYLFTGHSETLQGLKLPLTNVATTIYRKR